MSGEGSQNMSLLALRGRNDMREFRHYATKTRVLPPRRRGLGDAYDPLFRDAILMVWLGGNAKSPDIADWLGSMSWHEIARLRRLPAGIRL